VLLVLPALALTGCYPDAANSDSTTSTDATTSSAASTSGSATPQTATARPTATDTAALEKDAEAFTRCVRDHGVSAFPGVTVLSDGRLQLNSSSSFNPLSSTYQKAAQECASNLPAGTSLPSTPVAPSIAAPSLGIG